MNFCPTIKIFRESETSQQDGPYGQLLDVSQDVFTCDSAKVQKSPKTPPPLVPPRTFIVVDITSVNRNTFLLRQSVIS